MNLNDFMTPILAGIEAITGCMAILNVVGPMGCSGGDISAMTYVCCTTLSLLANIFFRIAHNVNLEAQPKTLFEWMPRRMDAWREHLKQWGYTYFTAGDMMKAKLPKGVVSAFGESSDPTMPSTNTDTMILEMLSHDVASLPDKEVENTRLNSDDEGMDIDEGVGDAAKAPAMPSMATSSSTAASNPSTAPSHKRPRTHSTGSSCDQDRAAPRCKTGSQELSVRPRPKPRPVRKHTTPDAADDQDMSPPPRRATRRPLGLEDDDEDDELHPSPPQSPPSSSMAVVQDDPPSVSEKAPCVSALPSPRASAQTPPPPPTLSDNSLAKTSSVPSAQTSQGIEMPTRPAPKDGSTGSPVPAPSSASLLAGNSVNTAVDAPVQQTSVEPNNSNDITVPEGPTPRIPDDPTRTDIPVPTQKSSAANGIDNPVVAEHLLNPPSDAPSIEPVAGGAVDVEIDNPVPDNSSTPPAVVSSLETGGQDVDKTVMDNPIPHERPAEIDPGAQNPPDGNIENKTVIGSDDASDKSSHVDANTPVSTLLRKGCSIAVVNSVVDSLRAAREEAMSSTSHLGWYRQHTCWVFDQEQWGPEWDALVSHWILLESDGDFIRRTAPLPAQTVTARERAAGIYRPELLERWVKDGRPPLRALPNEIISLRPENKRDAKTLSLPLTDREFIKFINLWNEWYTFMQPKWRKADGMKWSRTTGWRKDWGKLYAYGPNGWLSALACLWWWRHALDARTSSTDGKMQSWNEALSDVLWMVEGVRYHR